MKARLKMASGAAAMTTAGAVVVAAVESRSFTQLVRRDVDRLGAEAGAAHSGVVTREMLEGLPDPIQRYLTYTGVVGKPFPRRVHLIQRGTMRPDPTKPWIPLDAEEWYSVRPPGFVWAGRLHVGPLPVGRARDMYHRGEGHMLVKVAYLFTVVDATGLQMDQGSMMRYLSEMIWFPAAFLEDNISFRAVDDSSAEVTLADSGRTVTANLFIDGQGRLTDFLAPRYRTVGPGSPLETWSTPITGYGEFEGLRLPVKAKARWKLADGDLDYIDVTVTDLEYDIAPDQSVMASNEEVTTS